MARRYYKQEFDSSVMTEGYLVNFCKLNSTYCCKRNLNEGGQNVKNILYEKHEITVNVKLERSSTQ